MTTLSIFSEVLLELQEKNIDAAYSIATQKYMGTLNGLTDVNLKTLNLLRGQAKALCALRLSDKINCKANEKKFLDDFAPNALNERQINWGYTASIKAAH